MVGCRCNHPERRYAGALELWHPCNLIHCAYCIVRYNLIHCACCIVRSKLREGKCRLSTIGSTNCSFLANAVQIKAERWHGHVALFSRWRAAFGSCHMAGPATGLWCVLVWRPSAVAILAGAVQLLFMLSFLPVCLRRGFVAARVGGIVVSRD